MEFLHTFYPDPIFLDFGFVAIRWYGFFMVIALWSGLLASVKLAQFYNVKKDDIYDLFFYLVIFGFLGARLFYILYNPVYFFNNPLDVFKIWQGGIAIHGALVFGVAALIWFARFASSPRRRGSREKETLLKRRDSRFRGNDINGNDIIGNSPTEMFWLLSAVIAPGAALGQAIGRWGNYFNQELFGLPTNLPWGIPIALANRPVGFEAFTYFHPTFVYESAGNLIIFIVLLLLHRYVIKRKKYLIFNITYSMFIVLSYLFLYSLLRFFVEFLRIDPTAGDIFGVRATQVMALAGVLIGIGGIVAGRWFLWHNIVSNKT